ncbi:MAG TPA: RNA methyltransferase [Cytophagaceae bacterium]|nr:RNA methyltransferase [Cytophagaceae bacterium]
MFSKNKAKFIKSLQIKKFRTEYKQFLVEGTKSIIELINSDFVINELFVTEKFLDDFNFILQKKKIKTTVVKENELNNISSFSTNNSALAICATKENEPLLIQKEEWVIVLDEIKDPGNLGTIIRIADWYGIQKIICAETTADFYNPKVISSSMGSFTRVRIYYCDLQNFLASANLPVFAADLEGKDVHTFHFPKGGYLLMGNESDGLSKEVRKYITEKIHIPKYGYAESLNVAIATAIICDNIKRSC